MREREMEKEKGEKEETMWIYEIVGRPEIYCSPKPHFHDHLPKPSPSFSLCPMNPHI